MNHPTSPPCSSRRAGRASALLTRVFARALTLVFARALALVLAGALALCATPSRAGLLPFGPGERLTYELYWTFVHAGTAVLEVVADEFEGTPALRYKATARTTPFIDKFYKVRDRLESWTDTALTRSLHYEKEQHEGDYHKDVRLVFDWSRSIAYRWVRGELRHAQVLELPSFDPLSMLFHFRNQPLSVGYEFQAPVTDGNIAVMGKARVLKRETVKTELGEFDCFKVQPEIRHIGGVFKKSPDASVFIWITADERRIPVKVKSKVVVGHFTMEIAKIERADMVRAGAPE